MLSGLSVSLLDYSKSYEQAQGPSDEILVAKKYYFDGNLDLGPDPEIFLKDIYILWRSHILETLNTLKL